MARKTITAPLKIVATDASSNLIEFATSGDSSTAGTVVLYGGGAKMLVGPFVYKNIITSLAGGTGALNIANVTGLSSGPAMPKAGSVVGVSAVLNTGVSAGTLGVYVTVNESTVFGTSITSGRPAYKVQNAGTDTFTAGQRVGIRITTTADFAPTTADGMFYAIVTF